MDKQITLQTVIGKFEDKGINYLSLLMSQNAVPIFDPSSLILAVRSREDLFAEHKEMYKYQQGRLEYWNTWIDYQKHE